MAKKKTIRAKVDAKVFVQDKIVVCNIEGRDGKLSEEDKLTITEGLTLAFQKMGFDFKTGKKL